MTPSNIDKIQEFLPHRYPFLLLDRIVEVNTEEAQPWIKAYKNVSINEDFFNGHFPAHPIMPGVLIIEAMAQAAGVLAVYASGGVANSNIIYYLAATDKVRFKRPVEPGDQLQLEARILFKKRGIWKFECRALVEDELVCSAEITSAERHLEQE